jgi:hypothetical protein
MLKVRQEMLKKIFGVVSINTMKIGVIISYFVVAQVLDLIIFMSLVLIKLMVKKQYLFTLKMVNSFLEVLIPTKIYQDNLVNGVVLKAVGIN